MTRSEATQPGLLKTVLHSRNRRFIVVLMLFSGILAKSIGAPVMSDGIQIPPLVSQRISSAASALVASTEGDSRMKLHHLDVPGSAASNALFRWSFLPGKRPGLRHDEMTFDQRIHAQKLVRSTLSETGQLKWNAIVALEDVLRKLSRVGGGDDPSRTPGQYTFAILGDPSGSEPWGWRVEGHHVSLRFLLQGDRWLSSTPAFLGASPTIPSVGPNIGLEVLDDEEDLALQLARSLRAEQLEIGLRSEGIPRDIIHGPGKGVVIEPIGIRRDQLTPAQQLVLERLIDVHLGLLSSPLEQAEKRRIENAGLDSIRFCWWGPLEKNQKHSYRIHGPTTMIELVRVAGNPGHVHIVRRDPARDLDQSPLHQHLVEAHGK